MIMKIRFGLLGALFILLALPAAVSASDFGIDAHVGLLGYGSELSYSINDDFAVRGQFNRYSHTYSKAEEQINYNFGLNLKTYGVLFDWHPMAGSFRVTAGYFSNKNDIFALALPGASGYTINGHNYDTNQVSSLGGDITFNSGAPYFGIGWTTIGTKDTGLGFEFDLGALMQGSPKVTLMAKGTATSNATFQNDLQQENAKFQSDVDSFKTYPVIALGLVYRF